MLAGVPLHDVWAVDLPWVRSGITLDEFLRVSGARPFKPSRIVRALLGLRRSIGWLIDPFRNLIVYPSLLRSVRTAWNKTFESTSQYPRSN